MESVIVVPFRVQGDLQLLAAEDIEVDSVETSRAICYVLRNVEDCGEKIDLGLQLGAAGLFVYNYTLNETSLAKVHAAMDPETAQNYSAARLRRIFKSVLNVDYDASINSIYGLDLELVVLKDFKSFYRLRLLESFGPLGSKLRKEVATLRIRASDELVDSKGKQFQVDKSTEDYVYLLHEQLQRAQLRTSELALENSSLSETSAYLQRELKQQGERYEAKLRKIEAVALELVNAKKARIRELTQLLRVSDTGNDAQRDQLNVNVKPEPESDVEAAEDVEVRSEHKNVIERRGSSLGGSFASAEKHESPPQVPPQSQSHAAQDAAPVAFLQKYHGSKRSFEDDFQQGYGKQNVAMNATVQDTDTDAESGGGDSGTEVSSSE